VSEPKGLSAETISEVSATIRLDPRIYSREAILKAANWLTHAAYIHCPESLDGKIVVSISLRTLEPTLSNPKPALIDDIVGEFCNSLLEFELRRQVEVETSQVRQLIIAKAFSESGVLEEEPPSVVSDPVGIDVPTPLVQIGNKLAAPRD
jgi:His-Xaa-Ser system protein HxsD